MNTRTNKAKESKSQSVSNANIQFKNSKEATFQFVDNRAEAVAQQKLQEQPIQKKENNTGLPDNLKSGIENMSGYSMDDVKVHYNSNKPAQLNAHAYAQGTNIHVASGQEKHVPHEAWHVVQQKQGRVQPTTSFGGAQINDNEGLENEADVMVGRALQMKRDSNNTVQFMSTYGTVVQRAIDISVMDHTENDLYFTVYGGSKKLISKANAPFPQPIALYDEKDNTSVSGDDLKVWKPRSKLADKKKISRETPVYKENEELVTDLQEIQETVLMEIMREIETEVNEGSGRLGTAGINDCLGYAITLRHMIVAYSNNPQGLVGKTWVHQTNPEEADFPYHAATVVAEDGSDAVTLEAHAGQDITAPVFHIRHGGKTGFEEANKASAPGKYQEEAHEMDREAVDGIIDKIDMLKQGWADVNSRSDKSNVYETGGATVLNPGDVPAPQSQSSGVMKWALIGSLITAVMAGLIYLSKSSSK